MKSQFISQSSILSFHVTSTRHGRNKMSKDIGVTVLCCSYPVWLASFMGISSLYVSSFFMTCISRFAMKGHTEETH